MGMGMGMTMLSLLLALQHAVPRSRLGVATSFGQFSRSIGGAVGGVADGGDRRGQSAARRANRTRALMEIALHRAFVDRGGDRRPRPGSRRSGSRSPRLGRQSAQYPPLSSR